jgi:cobalt/nickel transport protein
MTGARRPSTKAVRLGMLVVALVLAGVVSYYAASSPDGLNRVAQDKGFASTEKGHPASDHPLAGYSTRGVGNDRLSTGLAGVAGVVVVLTLAGGLALVVRRRRTPGDEDAG